MAFYKVRQYKDPSSPEVQGKYYCQCVSVGTKNIKDIAAYIAPRSGVSVGHVSGILEDLGEYVAEQVANGASVEFGPLGYLNLRFRSQGTVTKEEWHPGLIERAFIGLRNAKSSKFRIGNIKLQKPKYWKTDPTEVKKEEDTPVV